MRRAHFALLSGAIAFMVSRAAADDFGSQIEAQVAAAKKLGADAAKEKAAAAATNFDVDLSGQFPPDAKSLNQLQVGSCHDFASTALLEAAYFRRYGTHRTVSKADLYIQSTLLGDDYAINRKIYFDDFDKAAHPLYAEYLTGAPATSKPDSLMSEGESMVKDFEYLKAHGAAAEDTVPYEAFYAAYSGVIRPSLQKVMAEVDEQNDANDARNGVSRDQKYLINGKTMDSRQLGREVAVQTRLGEANRALVNRFYDTLDRPKIERERADLREKSKDFRVGLNWDVGAGYRIVPDGSACETAGIPQKQMVWKELFAGRPVMIAVDIAGMKGWGYENAARPSWHAIDVVGFSFINGWGAFRTINSWGEGRNIPIYSYQFCRVGAIASVLTGSEN